MPNFVEIENSELIPLKADGGKNLSTMKKRTEHVSHFMTFLSSKGFVPPIDFEELAKSKELDQIICDFFTSLRVKKGQKSDELPRATYMEAYKSHLKCWLKETTQNTVDITDSVTFPDFTQVYKGLERKLKEHGKENCEMSKILM